LSRKRKKVQTVLLSSLLIPTLLFTSGNPSTSYANASASISTSASSAIKENSAGKISKKVTTLFKAEDRVSFIIKFKEQVDTSKVAKEAAESADKQNLSAAKTSLAKRSSIVTNLRATANETQAEVLKFLKKQEKEGNAKDVESFYIVNAIAVTATESVMEKIAAHPEVEKILPNETRQLIQPVAKTETKAETAVEPKAETASIE